jgi:hypothetical protein
LRKYVPNHIKSNPSPSSAKALEHHIIIISTLHSHKTKNICKSIENHLLYLLV